MLKYDLSIKIDQLINYCYALNNQQKVVWQLTHRSLGGRLGGEPDEAGSSLLHLGVLDLATVAEDENVRMKDATAWMNSLAEHLST